MLKYRNSGLFGQTATKPFDPSGNESTPWKFGRSPKELVNDLKKMGPTYIKFGQLLSTRPDLLPEAYLTAQFVGAHEPQRVH